MSNRCRECHFGRIKATFAPFLAIVAGRAMLIQNAPAFSCDFCGATEHDALYLQELQLILQEHSLFSDAANGSQGTATAATNSITANIIEEFPIG